LIELDGTFTDTNDSP